MKNITLIVVAILFLAGSNSEVLAKEYFVAKLGDDSKDGSSRETAFATIQKGVDALSPGDILTIAPGEYHESLKRIDLGNLEKETVIRAAIPGTVVLRGDLPVSSFRQVPKSRFVYVADLKTMSEVPVVNEIDTLTIFKRMPNASELEFIPGSFHHDAAAGKLYISTSDMKPPQTHHYSASVISTHGIYFVRPRRVTIEGIAMTGFSTMKLLHYREQTAGSVWGMFLVDPKSCVVRDCRAYLNGWGIGMGSYAITSGDNIIERCTAWGNTSAFANGDMGGITIFAARRDVIRHSIAFLNGMYGINIYGTGGAPPNADDGGNDPKNKSMLENNFAWGNETADIKIKTGYEYFHEVKNCVSPGYYSTTNVENCLIGRESGDKVRPADTIILGKETKLDLRSEFADPDHHDYRLQATSRFRGKGVDGKDRGPFPYAKNIYYVRTDGDDSADGLSVRDAWKSLARAVQNLKAGDTVYLDPGVYKADLDVQAAGKEGAPISFRGRGTGRTVIQGAVRIKESSNVEFLRLSFRDEVKIEKSREIVVDQCVFTSTTTALETVRVNKLKVTHCLFTGFQQAGINLKIGISRADLSGNIFDNAKGVALQFFFDDPPRYSNYNSYRDTAKAWEEDGKKLKFAEVQKGHEQHSLQLTPEFEAIDGIPVLKNAAQFAARGPHGKPIGPYQDKPRERELRLAVKPAVHSVSATTANLEWMTTLPATCQLAWGETPACEKAVPYSINCFGTYSLTGLKPGQRYYFRIKSIEPPTDMLPKVESKPIAINDEPITFTTLDKNPAPAVYYVAPDGNDEYTGLDRQKAWKTIRHAAAKVNVGDTVQIAGGKYSERIRIRATGDSGSPITFRAMTGERVDIDGNDLALHSGFVVSGKNNLHFDGLYFANFNMFPNDGWNFQRSGEFLLNNSKDIEISRCFSEGRGTYTASSVVAFYVENLHIKNCVNTYKMTGAMYLYRCPNLLIENTVFAAPMVMSFVLRNEKTQKATMTNCVFTDMLEKKAKFNIALLCVDGYVDSFRHRNNCYFVRVFSPEERILLGNSPIGKLSEYISEPLFADPQFAGDPGVKGNPKDKSGHGPDRMMDAGLKLDFNSFFATNPDLIKRGIGLQPEAFKDFHFNKATKP